MTLAAASAHLTYVCAKPPHVPEPSYRGESSFSLMSPELNLMGAMIWQAINDINFNQHKKKAMWWIFSDEIYPFSFRWICEHLSPDAERMVKEIRRKLRAGDTKLATYAKYTFNGRH